MGYQEPVRFQAEDGSWHTPRGMANMDKKGKRGGASGGEFGKQAMRVTESWTTPQAHDVHGAKTAAQVEKHRQKTGGGTRNLNEDVSNWATPRASANENRMTKAAPSHDGRKHDSNQKNGDPSLGKAAENWPTPRSEDSERCGNHRNVTDSLTGATKTWRSPNARDHHAQGPRKNAKQRQETLVDQGAKWSRGAALDLSYQKPRKGESSNAYWGRMARHEKKHGITREMLSGGVNWPTPTAAADSRSSVNDGCNRSDPNSKHHAGTTLTDAIRQWPTPTEQSNRPDHSRARRHQKDEQKYTGDDLGIFVERKSKWVTPASRDFKGTNSAKHALVTGTGKKHMDQLSNQVEYSFLSGRPRQETVKRGRGSSPSDRTSRQRLRLNPRFVEWLMNWNVGWTSLRPMPKKAHEEWEREMRNCLARIV